MVQQNEVRVGIIEDRQTTRQALVALLDGTPGYRCVGAWRSVEEALRQMPLNVPDVLLVDIGLPGISGSEGVRLLKERYPSLQILMLTVYADDERVFEALCNGAVGYLLKKTPPARLLDAIREVHEGGAPMSPEIARKVIQLFQKTGPPEQIEHRLRPHELQFLKMLAEGATYQMIAEHFHIHIGTVRKYILELYRKLHVHSKAEAVRKALKSGLIR